MGEQATAASSNEAELRSLIKYWRRVAHDGGDGAYPRTARTLAICALEVEAILDDETIPADIQELAADDMLPEDLDA